MNDLIKTLRMNRLKAAAAQTDYTTAQQALDDARRNLADALADLAWAQDQVRNLLPKPQPAPSVPGSRVNPGTGISKSGAAKSADASSATTATPQAAPSTQDKNSSGSLEKKDEKKPQTTLKADGANSTAKAENNDVVRTGIIASIVALVAGGGAFFVAKRRKSDNQGQ